MPARRRVVGSLRPRCRARPRGRLRRGRTPRAAGRGPSGGISSVRSLRATFSQCSRVGGDRLDFRRLDDEIGREIGRVMAIGAVTAQAARAWRRASPCESADPPRCAKREGYEGRETDDVTAHETSGKAASLRIGPPRLPFYHRHGRRIEPGVYSADATAGGSQRCFRARSRLFIKLLVAGSLPLAAVGTPLIDAVKRHDGAAVNALLDRGADIDAAEADGTTALHWATQLDDLATVGPLARRRRHAHRCESLRRHAARARRQQRQRGARRAPARGRRRSERRARAKVRPRS